MKRTIEHLKEVITICDKDIARSSEILKREESETNNNFYVAFLKMAARRNIEELRQIRHNAFINLNQEKMRKWGK